MKFKVVIMARYQLSITYCESKDVFCFSITWKTLILVSTLSFELDSIVNVDFEVVVEKILSDEVV